jgi:hypothetical protein
VGNLGFGWEEVGVNVGKDTSVSNGGVAHEFVKFFVVSDGEEDVSGDDSGLFVIFGGVSGKFQNFSGQIFKDGSEIDGGSGTNSFRVSSSSKETGNTTDGELETSSG